MKHLCEKRCEEFRRAGKSWEELTRDDKNWDELRKRWDRLSGGETRWEELRRGATRWEELRWVEKSWEEVGRGEIRWEELRKAGKKWKELRGWKRWKTLRAVEKSCENWEAEMSEKSCEEPRSGGHSWKGVRQDEDELHRTELGRQTLSLDPIASQSLNLETYATRLARVLLVGTTRSKSFLFCLLRVKMPYVPTPLQAPKKYSVTVRVYKKKKHTWTNDANLTIQRKISQRILDKPCSTFNQKEHKGWEHPKKQIGKDSANNVQTMASSSCFSSPGKSFSQGSWADSSRRLMEFQHPIHSRLRPFRLYKKVHRQETGVKVWG